MSKKNSHKTHNSPKIKYSKHKVDPVLEPKSDASLNLMPDTTANTAPNQTLEPASNSNKSTNQRASGEINLGSDKMADKELQAAVNQIKTSSHQPESKTFKSVDQVFINKHFSVLIAIILLLITSASAFFYLLNQPTSPTTAPNAASSDQSKAKVSQTEIEAINQLAITPDFPGLQKFSAVLNSGSALPLSQIDLDKRTGFKAGTEAALASDFDDLGQRLALVQSVALYEPNTAKNLNIKNYTQDGFQKLECGDVADECALFYRPSIKTERPIDAYRIYFRKNDFVFYFEFAKNDKHPELDQNWLKKVAIDLASRA